MLTDKQVQDLKLAHKQTRDKKVADRIKAVLMVQNGFTYEQIQTALLLDEVTVRRYGKQFEKKGVDGLLEYRYTGGKTKLSVLEQEALEAYLVAHTQRTAQQIRAYIQAAFAKEYTVIGVTKLLHRMGFTYKKPKVVPGNVSLALQEEFLKRYEALKEKLGKNDHLYFSDATHPTHNTKPSYGWIKKGKINDIYIKSNTGRKRINLVGALDITDKTAVVIEEKTIDAQAIVALLEAVRKKQKKGKVYLVVDNAKYHYARLVNHWLLHHPRFTLVFLPPYSPNLNIIERLWRFFHQKVTNNHYFESFTEFKNQSLAFFKNLKSYQPELNTLLTENFQTLPQLQT